MLPKLVLIACLAAITIEYVFGAPRSPMTEKELVKSFVEFLHTDKELASALGNGEIGNVNVHNREKRQSEIDMNDVPGDVEITGLDQPKKDSGFFDRAAKFVMEVLQRFLKWINTDD